MLTDLEKLNQIRAILDAPAAPAAQAATAQAGPTMAQPLVGYSFWGGVTSLPMPVEAGRIYTVETIGGISGYGGGSILILNADGSEHLPKQAIVNGTGYAHFQAQDTGTMQVVVDCDKPGLVRYAVAP